MATSQPNEVNQRYDHELEENHKYSADTLKYLSTKLEQLDIECLQMVKESGNVRGLRKTHIKDYTSKRKHYDTSFVRLEAQGLIRIVPDGTFRPYFITIRGEQMLGKIKDTVNESN